MGGASAPLALPRDLAQLRITKAQAIFLKPISPGYGDRTSEAQGGMRDNAGRTSF